MIRIVLPQPFSDELRGAHETAEVYDSAGNKLGMFTPQYVGYECPTPLEELDRIEKQGGGRPLADILRDLEKRA